MIHRKALYAGVFLATAGAVMLLARETPAQEAIADALGLWPVAIIAIGVALVVRQTRLGLAGGLIAAALPGLLLGGAVVAAPAIPLGDLAAHVERFVELDRDHGCDIGQPTTTNVREGSFGPNANVRIDIDCSDLEIVTIPGRGWSLATDDDRGLEAVVTADAERLQVTSDLHRFDRFRWAAAAMRLELPRDVVTDLGLGINAGRARLDLVDGRFGAIDLEVNASDAHLDLTGSALSRLTAEANAASLTITLPARSDIVASLDVNAASAVICAPPDLGLRITETTVLGDTTFDGLVRNGSAWESPDYASATYRADVSVSVNVGSVDINPQGGCK